MASKFFNSAFGLWKNLFYKSPLGSVFQLFDKSFTEDANTVVDSLGNGSTGIPLLDSYFAKTFDTGATGRDIEVNKLNMENQRQSWSNNVEGMKEAGLNPALMYGSSTASSAPSLSNSSGGSLSDLLALATLPAQLRLLNSQARNIDADTRFTEQKTLTEVEITRIKSIAAEYGVQMTEAEIQNLWSRTFNITRDTNLKMAQEDYIRSQKTAQDITNNVLDEKLRSEINSNNASAQSAAASAAFTKIQADYAQKHQCLMSSSDFVVIASYLGNLFHTSPEEIVDKFLSYINSVEFKSDMHPWKKVSSDDAFAWYLEHSSKSEH